MLTQFNRMLPLLVWLSMAMPIDAQTVPTVVPSDSATQIAGIIKSVHDEIGRLEQIIKAGVDDLSSQSSFYNTRHIPHLEVDPVVDNKNATEPSGEPKPPATSFFKSISNSAAAVTAVVPIVTRSFG